MDANCADSRQRWFSAAFHVALNGTSVKLRTAALHLIKSRFEVLAGHSPCVKQSQSAQNQQAPKGLIRLTCKNKSGSSTSFVSKGRNKQDIHHLHLVCALGLVFNDIFQGCTLVSLLLVTRLSAKYVCDQMASNGTKCKDNTNLWFY